MCGYAPIEPEKFMSSGCIAEMAVGRSYAFTSGPTALLTDMFTIGNRVEAHWGRVYALCIYDADGRLTNRSSKAKGDTKYTYDDASAHGVGSSRPRTGSVLGIDNYEVRVHSLGHGAQGSS
jgi:hypothetical protein